jgi:SAM-dependent methyltransferase
VVTGESLTRSFFEDLYAGGADPWSFATSGYEREKYDRSLAALAPRYAHALEIGCSVGVFTERLAARCERLLGVDISEHALATARTRCRHLSQVRLERADVTHAFPDGSFDLIVLSEVGYYWSDADLVRARNAIATAGASGGDVLLVHFLPVVPEYPRTGDAVHEAFLADRRFTLAESYRAERYRLDRLVRR